MLDGRLLFDVTKASKQKHYSGLARVSKCLRRELLKILGEKLIEVVWNDRKRSFLPMVRQRNFEIAKNDVLLTGELFCEYEREGIEDFLKKRLCRSYAVFHDAIPLQHPEFSWPHSVQRHPSYMKMLALFEGVFGVSQYSSMVLERYWEWLGYEYAPSVKSLQLGGDGVFTEMNEPKTVLNNRLQVLSLGIIEKRKGQDLLLEASQQLWAEGLEFDVHFVGRTNPYFGKQIEKKIRKAVKEGANARLRGAVDDRELQELFEDMDLMVFASRSEGCGLPVLESLWRGLPVLCCDLKPVVENSRFGGCRMFKKNTVESLSRELRKLVEDREELQALTQSIRSNGLSRWSDTAKELLDHLEA